jgi:hypothetical protein
MSNPRSGYDSKDKIATPKVIAPEQAKYLTNLTIYYTDIERPEQVYVFVPALRRSLRISSAGRCAPLVGWT